MTYQSRYTAYPHSFFLPLPATVMCAAGRSQMFRRIYDGRLHVRPSYAPVGSKWKTDPEVVG